MVLAVKIIMMASSCSVGGSREFARMMYESLAIPHLCGLTMVTDEHADLDGLNSKGSFILGLGAP